MLRVTAIGSEEAALKSVDDAVATRPDLALVRPPDEAARPAPATQAQRRGIGAWTWVLGVAIDAAVIAGVPLVWNLTIGQPGLRKLVFLYTCIAVVLLIPTHRSGRLVPRASELIGSVLVRLTFAPVIAVVLTWWIYLIDKSVLVKLVGITVPLVLVGRLVSTKVAHAVRSRGYDLEDTIIVGAGSVGRDLAAAMDQNPDCGLLPVGFVDRFEERLSHPLIGRPEDLLAILEETQVRHVVLGFGGATETELVGYVRECAHLPVQFYTVPRFFELGVSAGQGGFEVDGFAITPLGRPGRQHLMWPLKRAFDVAVSGFVLLAVSPVYLACALAVKLTSPGPVYFRQVRVSVDHVPFDILKFRTMKYVADPQKQAELDQRAQAVNLDDDRITPIGKFLRKSHLDELPQLLNVLKGEMSIVGPRPERPYFVDQHTATIEGYAHRHRVPAGITGWAQVNGFWGDSSLEARVRLDNRYIENWTPWRDLVIGLRTIPTLLGKRR